MQVRDRWFIAAMGTIVAACIAVAAPNFATADPAPAVPIMRAQTVAFLGDSYTAGTDQGGLGNSGYVARLAARDGFKYINAATGGTGYVNPGDSQPFEARQIGVVPQYRPDAVVVVGSRNDADEPALQVQAAAAHLFEAVRQQSAPGVKIVAVGPVWSQGPPTPGVLRARDAVKAAAAAEQVPFVDPIAERWLDGPGLIGADGVHPTNEGHAVLADRIGKVLADSQIG